MMMLVVAAQSRWWCPMCGGYRTGGWGMIFVGLFWLVVIVAVAWVIARAAGSRGGGIVPGGKDNAEAILRERYARGEIDEATYRRMLEELRRS